MVCHFRTLASHRNYVTSIYRTLLRHSFHIDDFSSINKDRLIKFIAFKFKSQKSQMSGYNVKASLEQALQLEENLRNSFAACDDTYIKELLKNFRHSRSKTPQRSTSEEAKEEVPSVASIPLETQRTVSDISKHLHRMRLQGKLPKKIDPIIIQELIKPELNHRRATMIIRKTLQKISKGPYKPHITCCSARFKFIRNSFKQKNSVTRLIKTKIRKDQEFYDISSYIEESKKISRLEELWADVTGIDEFKGYGNFYDEYFDSYKQKFKNQLTKYSIFEETRLPRLLVKSQAMSDKLYSSKKKKFLELLKKSKNCTAFEDLLQAPTLYEMVKEYNLEKRPRET